ncbi:hypothetical protein WKI65_44055 [Streptomyces sp. MS1.AVA.3]|uniref:hypothetical protein n=1 Tax=Streptomyces decoyicus TaxID=249567 RepID=UPI0030BD108E
MGRHKQHKPRRQRESAPPEWFGTAFHSVAGMQHLDIRPSGNGVLLTSSPADLDGTLGVWQLRLRNDDEGRGLSELGAALAAGRAHGLGHDDQAGTVVMFLPDHPEPGVATLARIRNEQNAAGDVRIERCAERPMQLWAEAGENLIRITALLDPDTLAGSWPQDDCLPCPGCARPVFDTSSSSALVGTVPPIVGLCRLCANGTTLHSLRQADVPLPAQQRAVLDTVAAAMT